MYVWLKTAYNTDMKHTLPITKKRAIELLGGSAVLAAQALQYKSRQAIHQWPDVLPYRDGLMVLGAVFLQQGDSEQPDVAPRRVKRRSWLVRGGRAI